MKLFAVSDLYARWNYTRAGIHKLLKKEDFPKPVDVVNCGKTKLFNSEDIEAYEKERPWLFDENQKLRRQNLYFRLQQVKEAEPREKQQLLEKLFGNTSFPKMG